MLDPFLIFFSSLDLCPWKLLSIPDHMGCKNRLKNVSVMFDCSNSIKV